MGIVSFILIAVFLTGFFVAGTFCKNIAAQIFVGILLGVGFVAVLCGIAFAGCLFMLRGSHF